MRVSVLGATEVWRDEQQVQLGTRKRRALLAALALSGGHPVSVDALVDLVWGEEPPGAVTGTVQVHVSGLRRALEPERAPRAPATVLVTVTPGYALRLPHDTLDAERFERAVAEGQRRLGQRARAWSAPALSGDELVATLAGLDAGLALWRGIPYVDLADAPAAVAERARLEELRVLALEGRAVAALALGDHGTVAAELRTLTAAYPLREQLWTLQALALARSGRQADALETLRLLREVLDTELGLEPGLEARELQAAVLRQDPELDWKSPRGVVDRRPTARASTPTPAAPPRRAAPSLPSWPLVGRDAQLEGLTSAFARAEGGRATFVALTGEPGIGKSRLCAELAGVAVEQGARLLVGRCSQDDGAPPLWPWQQVLRHLGADLPVVDADDEGAEFRTWDSIVHRVRQAAALEPVVLVLDDLHWADVPTLRVLRLLVETVDADRLLMLVTWRHHPEPTGALADVAEALARRHAERLPLTGLSGDEAARIVTAVTELVPTTDQADQLTARTDGNPFFLVEYARLAQEGGDLGALMSGEDPPAAVGDVIVRRVERLPEESRRLLRWAAVLGREFDLTVLAEVVGASEDDVLDRLEPAVTAGLLREEDIGRYLFGHALVRDTLHSGLSPTRRARAHARAAAVLEEYADRETEVARHWLAAGPAHAAAAWRSAVAAATEVTRTRHAYGIAAELLTAGLASMVDDPGASVADRYRVLMELADAHRWQGDWISLLDVATSAIAAATELDDVCRLAEAASSMTRGALWQSPAHGADHPVVITALRRALAELPTRERELRCRAMLALAAEAYYTSPVPEREALVEEALSLARTIGDDSLLVHACQIGFVATWRPATAAARLDLALEGAERAGHLGDERSVVVARDPVRRCARRARAGRRHVADGTGGPRWRGAAAPPLPPAGHRGPAGPVARRGRAVRGGRVPAGRHPRAHRAAACRADGPGRDRCPRLDHGLAWGRRGRRRPHGARARRRPPDVGGRGRDDVAGRAGGAGPRVRCHGGGRPVAGQLVLDAQLGVRRRGLRGAGRPRPGRRARTTGWPRTPASAAVPAPGPTSAPSTRSWPWPPAPPATATWPAGTRTDAATLCETWQVPLVAQWLRDQRDRYSF